MNLRQRTHIHMVIDRVVRNAIAQFERETSPILPGNSVAHVWRMFGDAVRDLACTCLSVPEEVSPEYVAEGAFATWKNLRETENSVSRPVLTVVKLHAIDVDKS